MSAERGVLVLQAPQDGEVRFFDGYLFGAKPDVKSRTDKGYGEVVFNTSMTGYQEILTDPSYYGEIVCMTAPHIGNTGVNPEDVESKKLWIAGLVIHDLCEVPSNWRSTQTLNDYLIKNNVPGLYGVQTRALTRYLRQFGVLRGLILPESERAQAQKLLAEIPTFEGRDLIKEVTVKEPYQWSKNKGRYKVAALDFGIKHNLLRSLEARGCEIIVYPAQTPSAEILKQKPDGVFLSNGPGDPAAARYAVKTVKELLGQVPIFGVCMGHQILSLAAGGKTYKLKFGHRGGNQPVFDEKTKCVEISSHNHGYSVDEKSLPADVKVTHINLNDRTVEGIALPGKMAFSVQFHPEACPGPHDSIALFDRFIELMNDVRKIS